MNRLFLSIAGATLGLATALTVARAQNIVIEYGPHYGDWQCAVLGSVSTPGSLSLSSSGLPPVYDAAGEFSTNSNPNGHWSYGWSATLGGALTLYTDNGQYAD